MELSAIKRMENLAQGIPGVVSLSQGTPAQGTDLFIREKAIEAIEKGLVDKYSDPAGILSLRKAICHDLHKRGMEYSIDEIIVSVGSIEGLTAAMLSLFSSEDEVIFFSPCYAAYSRICALAKIKPVFVELTEENGWSLDLEQLRKSITEKTKGILICNPNNPTGTVFSKKELQIICDLAIEKNILIILDDIYGNIYYDEEKPYNPCIEKKYRNHIIRLVSFSKDFAMTGWRIGYVHADRKMIEKILPIHDAMVNCAPVVSQFAALAALEIADNIIISSRKRYTKQRDLMGNALEKLSDYIEFSWPDGSYFFFPKIKNIIDSEAFCINLLKKAKVAIVPGNDFGSGGEGHVRLCFGRSEYEILEGMKRLENYFQTL